MGTEKVETLLIDVKGVAAMLGVHRASVFKLRNTGRMPPPLRILGAVRWRRREIEDWVRAGMPPAERWEWAQAEKTA